MQVIPIPPSWRKEMWCSFSQNYTMTIASQLILFKRPLISHWHDCIAREVLKAGILFCNLDSGFWNLNCSPAVLDFCAFTAQTRTTVSQWCCQFFLSGGRGGWLFTEASLWYSSLGLSPNLALCIDKTNVTPTPPAPLVSFSACIMYCRLATPGLPHACAIHLARGGYRRCS
jgi:hypothetical protein